MSWRFGVKAFTSPSLSKCPSYPSILKSLPYPPYISTRYRRRFLFSPCPDSFPTVEKVASTLTAPSSFPIMHPDPLLHLKTLLSSSEIIEPSSPSYHTESLTWAAQKNLHPRLVVRPTSVQSLSSTLSYLSQTQLDFAIRSQGFGSSSAKDVLISMTGFDGFEFDRENEVVTVGAGQTWEDYYKKMEDVAPDYNGRLACLLVLSDVGSIADGGLWRCSRCVSNAMHWYRRVYSLRWLLLAVGRTRPHFRSAEHARCAGCEVGWTGGLGVYGA